MNRFLDEIKKANNEMSRTIVVDLDGVIVDFNSCEEGCDYSSYPEKPEKLHRMKCPLASGCIEVLNYLKYKGINIIIHTGRTEAEREITEKWLKLHKVPHDQLIMEKPRGFIYCDDLGYQHTNWSATQREILRRM